MGTRIDWSLSNFSFTIFESSYEVKRWNKIYFLQFKTAQQSSWTIMCSVSEAESISHLCLTLTLKFRRDVILCVKIIL